MNGIPEPRKTAAAFPPHQCGLTTSGAPSPTPGGIYNQNPTLVGFGPKSSVTWKKSPFCANAAGMNPKEATMVLISIFDRMFNDGKLEKYECDDRTRTIATTWKHCLILYTIHGAKDVKRCGDGRY